MFLSKPSAQILYMLQKSHILQLRCWQLLKICIEQRHQARPDGFHTVFFQKVWGVLGLDVTQMVFVFLNNDAEIDLLNEIYLALIPKVKNPERASEFQPISLCNVCYKLMSKVITNRLCWYLLEVVDEALSAFIVDRLTTDNAILEIRLCIP